MNRLADLSWDQVQEYLVADDRVILPIGATEEHGRHLGMGCDHLLAEAIALGAGERTGVLVAPTLAYGMSHSLLEFPGTLSLSPETLMAVLKDLLRALYRHGFRHVLVVNGHGGNTPSLSSALAGFTTEQPDLRAKAFTWWTEAEISALTEQMAGPQRGTHAAAGETAFLMHVRPEGYHRERIAHRDAPVTPAREFTSARLFRDKYPDGVMGLDPTPATAELGARLLALSLEMCAGELESW